MADAALSRLSHRDLGGVISVVAEAAPADGAQPFELEVIERLVGLVLADRVGYYEYEHGGDCFANLFLSETPTYDFQWPRSRLLIRDWPLHDRRLSKG